MIITILSGFLNNAKTMIIKGQTEYKYHIKKALNKMQNVNKWQYYFILEVIGLFLSMRGELSQCQVLKPCITMSYCSIDLLACSVFHHT